MKLSKTLLSSIATLFLISACAGGSIQQRGSNFQSDLEIYQRIHQRILVENFALADLSTFFGETNIYRHAVYSDNSDIFEYTVVLFYLSDSEGNIFFIPLGARVFKTKNTLKSLALTFNVAQGGCGCLVRQLGSVIDAEPGWGAEIDLVLAFNQVMTFAQTLGTIAGLRGIEKAVSRAGDDITGAVNQAPSDFAGELADALAQKLEEEDTTGTVTVRGSFGGEPYEFSVSRE